LATRRPALEDPNQDIASLILDLAEVYRPSPRYWGYKRASRTIRRHPQFLSELTDAQILKIPNIGPATLRIVREFLDAGESPTANRILAGSGKDAEIEQRRAMRKNFLSAAMVEKVLSEPRKGAVRREEYLGDFQMHSRGSDGSDTVAQLAKGCRKRGYRCMAVTDHSYGLPIAGGMSMTELRAQRAEIKALNTTLGGEFHVLQGVEANILQDGQLDMKASELRALDLVVASPHSSLRKTIDQTGRMLTAVSLPGVHILGHPRGRMFNLRHGVIADWPKVFRKAAETGVAIEIDGDVSRQDLDFSLAMVAGKAGCVFALDSDAHAADQLWMADYAIAHARLAGIPAARIINCWPTDKLVEWAAGAWSR
jgi:histidinol phosphatase-like PHP family hydrolase